MHGSKKCPIFLVELWSRRFRFCAASAITWITSLVELTIPMDIKVVCLHEALLFDLKSAMEIALEGGFCGGPNEENVSKSKV